MLLARGIDFIEALVQTHNMAEIPASLVPQSHQLSNDVRRTHRWNAQRTMEKARKCSQLLCIAQEHVFTYKSKRELCHHMQWRVKQASSRIDPLSALVQEKTRHRDATNIFDV